MIPIRRMAAGGGARAEAAVRAFKTHSRCADSLAAFLSDPASSLEDDAAVLFVYSIALEGTA